MGEVYRLVLSPLKERVKEGAKKENFEQRACVAVRESSLEDVVEGEAVQAPLL